MTTRKIDPPAAEVQIPPTLVERYKQFKSREDVRLALLEAQVNCVLALVAEGTPVRSALALVVAAEGGEA